MSREGTRPLAALVVAAVAAALLAACGSSGSDSAGTASSSTATDAGSQAGSQGGPSQSTPTKSGARGQSGGQGQAGGQSKQAQAQQGSGGPGRKTAETPLEVSGGGSGQFRTKDGDNSIQEFGDESGESELQEAAEVVHGFYVSRVAGEWSKACSYLAEANIEQLEKLVSQSGQSKGADCATALQAFTQPLPASVQREITTVDAGSLRREGEQGFLIYFGAGGIKYAMPLREEGGSWKVTALSGTTLG